METIRKAIPVSDGMNSLGQIFKLFMILCVCGLCLLGPVLYYYYKQDYSRVLKTVMQSEESAVELEVAAIDKTFYTIIGDLLLVAQQNELVDLDTTIMAEDQYAGMDLLGREFLEFLKIRRIYDQARFIDPLGMERVRVNYNNGVPSFVPRSELQDKHNRYYFVDTFKLQPGEIYISPLDLNMEHGKVEVPYKPVMRFATPIYGAGSVKIGIVVLNYMAESMLDSIKQATPDDDTRKMLLNSNGFWLINPDFDLSWGFMFPDRNNQTFSNVHPDIWELILEKKHGQILAEDGLFSFFVVYPAEIALHYSNEQASYVRANSSGGAFWVVVRQMPLHVLGRELAGVEAQYVALALGGSLILTVSMFLVSWGVVQARRHREQIRILENHDNLTGLPNRELFKDRLDMAMHHAIRERCRMGLLVLDITHFTAFNRMEGRHAGDELLMHVAIWLEQSIRNYDTVARLGADEFAIILFEVKALDDLMNVGERVTKNLSGTFAGTSMDPPLKVAIGASIYPDNAVDPDTLIAQAEEAMARARSEDKVICLYD